MTVRGINFCEGWKFKETEALQNLHTCNYDDKSWETVTLPHDWSIKKPFNEELGDGCTAYLLGGIGWYRKHFVTTREMKEGVVMINFDGIYNRADIYCNGVFIKFHPYGYAPCVLNLSKYLNEEGQDNVIAVRVDHSRYADSRWYTGSGIYRKVSLQVLPKVHIPVWGVQVTTSKATTNEASVRASIALENKLPSKSMGQINVKIINPSGEVATTETLAFEIGPLASKTLHKELTIKHPVLWQLLEGKQYEGLFEVVVGGNVIQTEHVKFGIRTFTFDANKGFFINGKNTLIKGVCLHHDAGLVGAAVPLDVWKRRLQKLIDCGCNAIRTAHNPFSEDFLDLCDTLGLFVQEEFYDEWDNPKDKRYNGNEKKVDYITRGHAEFFKDYAKEDLQNVVRRDINHPCIIQWSIGNEIEWTYPKYNLATGYFGANASGNYFWQLPPYSLEKIRENISQLPHGAYEVGTTAKKLTAWTKEMDTTRPVIANCILPSASYESGYVDALDMVGYSYRQVVYAYGHENYPDKPIMGTENLGQWHEWKHVLEKDYIPGIFLWTGVDYLGESGNVDVWPRKATRSGLLDLAGFEKPSYYMFKSLWQEEPTLYFATQTLQKSPYTVDELGNIKEEKEGAWKQRLWVWHDVNEHWNYTEGEQVAVEIYSNCEWIELYQDETLISKAYLSDFEDHIYKWPLTFAKGTLKAVGEKDGKRIETVLNTAGEVASIQLCADKEVIHVHPDEVVHITAQIVDKEGNKVSEHEEKITFEIEGSASLVGVDNGDTDSVQDYLSDTVKTRRGQCLLMIKGSGYGEAVIKAKIGEIVSNVITIDVK